MSRALVLTVGTGTRSDSDITQPLVLSIRDSNPERVVFLVSETSEPVARRVCQACALGDERVELVGLRDPEHVDRVAEQALEALRGLRARGFAPREIDADFTSGTKAMSAGLALAALAFGCNALKYVTGRREQGVVVSGTEEIRVVRPAATLAQRELEVAVRGLRLLQYRAARAACTGLVRAALSEYDRRLADGVDALAEAYDAWDKFKQGGFMGAYRRADLELAELAPFRLAAGVGERVVRIGQARQERRVSRDLLADLFNNAERRGREGRFDDQVARLYRAVEMLAQRELQRQHEVSTDDVHPEALPSLPAEVYRRLEERRNARDGQIKLGLQDAYGLLEALGHPLGGTFRRDQELSAALNHRNASILAHGVQPIDERQAQALDGRARKLARVAVPDLDERCSALQFPWLREG
ncbi:MAG: TIGR02710 family CRISPR-associated protein [Chloroflexi bacterium]|nr:TIGR02710 family CRISPR-associated protein [Chloroflexota bacterium]